MEYEEREIELIDYIEVILKRKKLILALTLLCALSTYAFVKTRPQTYEAESLVVVTTPITNKKSGEREGSALPGTEISVSSLSAQTYEVLAKSDELLRDLADTLKTAHEHPLFADLSLPQVQSALAGMFAVELLKETVQANSPLLAFRARSSDEALPVVAVNLWTQRFVQRNQGLSSNVADSYYQWVQEQYRTAKDNLEQTEDRLRQVQAGYHSLNILQSDIGLKNARLESTLKAYQALSVDLQDKKAQRDHLRRVVSNLEAGGQWIGYLPTKRLPPRPGAATMRAELIELVYALEDLERDSLQVAEKNELLTKDFQSRREKALQTFERDRNVEQTRKHVQGLDATLTALLSEAAGLKQRIKSLELELDVHQQNLEQQPRMLVLTKAIADEALWDQVAEDGKIAEKRQSALGRYGLKTEELNPIHQQLAAEVADLQVRYDTFQKRRTFLDSEIPGLQNEYLVMHARLDTLEQEETQLHQRLERERTELYREIDREAESVLTVLQRRRELFDQFRAYYLEQKDRLAQLEREISALELEFAFQKSSFSTWKQDIEGLAEEADSLLLQRTRLERDQEVFRETFQRFSRLSEEARIAREQAAGDIQIVSRATQVTPVPQNTTQKLAISVAVGLMLSVFLAFLLEYVDKARAQKQEAGTHA